MFRIIFLDSNEFGLRSVYCSTALWKSFISSLFLQWLGKEFLAFTCHKELKFSPCDKYQFSDHSVYLSLDGVSRNGTHEVWIIFGFSQAGGTRWKRHLRTVDVTKPSSDLSVHSTATGSHYTWNSIVICLLILWFINSLIFTRLKTWQPTLSVTTQNVRDNPLWQWQSMMSVTTHYVRDNPLWQWQPIMSVTTHYDRDNPLCLWQPMMSVTIHDVRETHYVRDNPLWP